MERRRAMFSMCSYEERTTEGEDSGRSGQHEWWTAGSVARGLSEDSGRCMRSGQQGGHREERTATMVDRAVYTFKRALLIKRVVFI